jgi:hypothetical protein
VCTRPFERSNIDAVLQSSLNRSDEHGGGFDRRGRDGEFSRSALFSRKRTVRI